MEDYIYKVSKMEKEAISNVAVKPIKTIVEIYEDTIKANVALYNMYWKEIALPWWDYLVTINEPDSYKKLLANINKTMSLYTEILENIGHSYSEFYDEYKVKGMIKEIVKNIE